jgi:WD40 repeat protein
VVWSVAYSPGGRLLASAGDDGTVKVWGPATGSVRTLKGHTISAYCVAFSRDGTRLLSAGGHRWQPRHAGEVIVWDAATGEERALLPGDSCGFFAAAFTPDGRRLACAAMDRTVKLCELAPLARGTAPGREPGQAPPR